MKIILLNGPPRSGKDTAAKLIHQMFSGQFSMRWEKFSLPHKRAFAGMMGVPINDYGDVEWYEDHKEVIIPGLGFTFRQWQIDFSEFYMKPCYGEDIFGRLLLKRQELRLNTPRYICTVADCGFQIEYDTITAAVPPKDVMLIRLRRDGTTFKGDSRKWVVGLDEDGVAEYEITNNGTIDELSTKLEQLIYDLTEDYRHER